MKNRLSKLDRKTLSTVKMIGEEAKKVNREAYLVGGFVRDVLLGKGKKDVDVVVEGSAEALARRLKKKCKAGFVAHPRFGTAVVIFPNGSRVDLATARKEKYPHPGALPVVSQGKIHDDLSRRDFTINTLAVSINPDRFGLLLDEFFGRRDLKDKKIRILHDKSFEDDPTRILRAVRFEQRLSFRIEKKTLSLLKTALGKNAVKNVKAPRYFEEFKKILTEQSPQKPVKRLDQLNALDFLNPGFKAGRSTVKFLEDLNREVISFKRKFKGPELDRWVVFFIGVTYKVRPKALEKICDRFQLSNKVKSKILCCPDKSRVIRRLSAGSLKPSGIYQILKPLSFEMVAALKAGTKNKTVRERIDRFLAKYSSVKLRINGDDLKKLGVLQGKRIGFVLEKVLSRKIDGGLKSKEDELEIARGMSLNR